MQSSSGAEYPAMSHGACEFLWLKVLLKELGFVEDSPMISNYDNTVAIYIASNLVYHECTNILK